VAERAVTQGPRHLNLTRSATSAAIAALEARYATKLFDRVRRRIALTQAGRLFLTEARSGARPGVRRRNPPKRSWPILPAWHADRWLWPRVKPLPTIGCRSIGLWASTAQSWSAPSSIVGHLKTSSRQLNALRLREYPSRTSRQCGAGHDLAHRRGARLGRSSGSVRGDLEAFSMWPALNGPSS